MAVETAATVDDDEPEDDDVDAFAALPPYLMRN